jgi:hypothetical protein
MKLFTLAAAAAAMLIGAAPVAAAPAPAPVMAAPALAAAPPQRYGETRTVRRTVVRRDRSRSRWSSRRVCRTERHNGRRERVCRTVRYRR